MTEAEITKSGFLESITS